MKKFLVFTTLFLSLSAINAQNKFEAGFKMGYVNSKLDETYNNIKFKSTSKSNVYISIPMEYKLHKNISLNTELGMAGLGGENLESVGGTRLHLTTIYIPLGIKVYPIQNFSLNTGFNFGFVVKALGKQNGQNIEYEDIKTSNNSYYLGAEYKISGRYIVEARYNKGVSNLIDSNLGTMKNNFLQIGVGYIYPN